MRNLTIYLVIAACLLAGKITAQETFETRARQIADKIEKITINEKEALKIEIEEVNKQFENGTITKAEADVKKKKLAEARAIIIENKIVVAQEELKELVQQKVNGNIEGDFKPNSIGSVFSKSSGKNSEKYQKRLDSIANTSEKRTTSQLVLATGANNLVTNGAVSNSDFNYNRSVFWEIGMSFKTRILQNSNLLQFKYGISGMYNMLNATDNRYFVDNNGQTELAYYPTHLRTCDTYFKNVYVAIPLHLEFDFSKTKKDIDGNNIFRSQQGFRFGIGGFVGYNTNSKQFLSYEENGYRVNERQKGDWNVNDWTYGLSTYVGYRNTSLYLKYDLNPMFKNNAIDQNNISLGLRFDFN